MSTEKLNIPAAIIVTGLIIALAIYASGTPKTSQDASKSIAARIGLNEKKLQACVASETYKDRILTDSESGERAMAILPPDQRGTPFNVIMNVTTGTKVQLAGAYPYESFKAAIDGLIAQEIKGEAIDLAPVTENDHWMGNKDAQIVIVEYADLECPYCAVAHPTIKKIIADYDGKVAWVFRHFPLSIHPNAHIKAQAAECAWEQGKDKAFFDYVDATYADLEEKMKPKFDTSIL